MMTRAFPHLPSPLCMKRPLAVAVLFLLSILNAEFAWADKLMLPHHMRYLSGRKQIWRSKLSKKDLDAIVRRLSQDVEPKDCLGDEQSQTRPRIVRSFRIEEVDLTADDKSQYLVQGSGSCVCGATGNCPVWVTREKQHRICRAAFQEGLQRFFHRRHEH